MSITNQKGDIGEAYFMLRAREKGYWVGAMPQDCPYDFVLDRGAGLERVQVKYRATSPRGTIQLTSENSSMSSNRTYKAMVDQFAVYSPETKEVYLIPAELVNAGSAAVFRVSPSKNGQAKNVRYLSEYSEW